MAEPTLLLQSLEDLILDALNPLVGQADDKLRQIEVLPLSAAEKLPELLEKHRSRLPGAYLSIPQISPLSRERKPIDVTLSYAFLVGIATRKEIDWAKRLAYTFFQQSFRQIVGRDLNGPGNGVPAHLDFIRFTGWDFAEVEGSSGGQVSASFMTFDLGVRNWRP